MRVIHNQHLGRLADRVRAKREVAMRLLDRQPEHRLGVSQINE
jgi:hypothetical protein